MIGIAMARVTRNEYLDTAETLFAERGFYGVSIAAIANELGLTKQALLHHFGSKEKLYGEVLRRISEGFDGIAQSQEQEPSTPEERLRAFFTNLYVSGQSHSQRSRLLMRELLDNNQRAETASRWYLKPFLEDMIAMIKALPRWQQASQAEALAAGYQLLGAINYYGISSPTLSGIFGRKMVEQLEAQFLEQLDRLIDAVIERASGPSGH